MGDALSFALMALGRLGIFVSPYLDPDGNCWRVIRKELHARGVTTLTNHTFTPEELERPKIPPPDPEFVLKDKPAKMGGD